MGNVKNQDIDDKVDSLMRENDKLPSFNYGIWLNELIKSQKRTYLEAQIEEVEHAIKKKQIELKYLKRRLEES